MNKEFKLTVQLLNKSKQFYHSQQGVYAVMTALLAFPLLFLITFTVDGTGMLLDRARLAQATDQSALLLVAENNLYRDNQKHSDVDRQDISGLKIKEYGSLVPGGASAAEQRLRAQQDKRNQELVQGIVKVYLRSYDKNSTSVSTPITIPKNFDISCKASDNQGKSTNGRQRTVACMVQGSVERKFWLPWSYSLNSTEKLDNDKMTINSGVSYAIKERAIAIPVDLMMVTDLSKSMRWYIDEEKYAPKPNRRIDALVEVVGKIQDILLPKEDKEDVSPYNRIGFASFAAGARQKDDTAGCVLPYYVNNDATVKKQLIEKLKGEEIGDGLDLLDENLDIPRTIGQIKNFNGQKQSYDLTITSDEYCLGENAGRKTTQAWFDKKNPNVAEELGKIVPRGGTAVTSGIFIGVNLLADKNTAVEAAPDKLGVNTRRVLLILSDGEDNRPSTDTLANLMDAGLCKAIKEKVNSLQAPNYAQVETRVAFIAFGTKKLPKNQVKAWKGCVGEHYYPVSSKDELLKAFKQIISFEEEVGTSSSDKPDLLK